MFRLEKMIRREIVSYGRGRIRFQTSKRRSSTISLTHEEPMKDDTFDFMRRILAAPSPVGLEGAMTHGVLTERFHEIAPSDWKEIKFKGNASVVWDSDPEGKSPLTVMIVGHADKIRMQVRSIAADGKIWINSDSFLPQTLIGNPVRLFSEDPEELGRYREINGTVEALGAIHFAPAKFRTGDAGIKPNQLYLELGLHGKKRKELVENLGIRPGDSILLDRPIERCFAPDTFSGAYLDNGLGCFVTAEIARRVANGEVFKNADVPAVRCLFTYASHEEIGRFGSRVLASELKPDVIVAVDVNHDYEAAPIGQEEKHCPLTMGKGFTLSVGATTSEQLNALVEGAAGRYGIPFQRDVVGRDTGTDAMAGVLGNIDAAVTSIGFPIRNMHTISELAHTGDVQASVDAICATLKDMADKKMTPDDFREGHPRLDAATLIREAPRQPVEDGSDE